MILSLASGQNLFDLLLLAFAVLVLPALSAFNGARLAKAPDKSLVPRYLLTAARGWFIVALIAGAWWRTERPLAALGLDIPVGSYGRLGLLLAAVATLALIAILLSLKRLVTPARYAKLLEQMRHIKILPRTGSELRVFLAVAVTAGVWEELLYRGFLIWFLSPHVGVVAAVAVSTIVFGLGHIYQGWRGAMSAGTLGLLFAVAYVASGSLWWVMAAHALVDLYGGLLAWRITHMRMPEAQTA